MRRFDQPPVVAISEIARDPSAFAMHRIVTVGTIESMSPHKSWLMTELSQHTAEPRLTARCEATPALRAMQPGDALAVDCLVAANKDGMLLCVDCVPISAGSVVDRAALRASHTGL